MLLVTHPPCCVNIFLELMSWTSKRVKRSWARMRANSYSIPNQLPADTWTWEHTNDDWFWHDSGRHQSDGLLDKPHIFKQLRLFHTLTSRCSRCAEMNTEWTLQERTYTCRHCGIIKDRDLNAAENLLDNVKWLIKLLGMVINKNCCVIHNFYKHTLMRQLAWMKQEAKEVSWA